MLQNHILDPTADPKHELIVQISGLQSNFTSKSDSNEPGSLSGVEGYPHCVHGFG